MAAKKGEAAPDCGLCHGGAHELLAPRSQQFRAAVPDTCGMCHTQVVEQFRGSVHGQALAKGINEAPLCTDCHGEHSIIKHTNAASPVSNNNIRETCGSCHGDVRLSRKFGLPGDRMVSFDASFHGLAAKAGQQTVANCASCHGVHNILPSSDARSTISAKNLPQTCGRCHPGAGERFAIGQVHVREGGAEPAGMRWARQFYLLVIPLTLGLMLLHNAGDWFRKIHRARVMHAPLQRGGPPRNVRMLPFERVQHAMLALSFIVLAVTGFALKYPDQWWAQPFLLGGGSMRSLIHRIAAVVMMAGAAVHVITLVVSPPMRRHWLELMPRAADLREALANFAYNLGLIRRKPYRSSHSYIEKAEYWAVVWGTAVMALTGVMLWANNIMLKFLPKSWLDVATSVHFYEAVLATASIVIWHFYTVIFDPEVYPLDTAFLTGKSVREHEEHEVDEEEQTKATVS
ncbi:MAG: cytochrome b/b6 domain-containing protein [Bryobacteraceae bacterium]